MADVSAADQAYEAALKAIAKAINLGAKTLSLDAVAFRTLGRIPPEVRNIPKLTSLVLDNTAITDLSPLRGIATLRWLQLNQTKVGDLSPLKGMAGLHTLSLNQTKVSDLSPLQGIIGLYSLNMSQTAVSDLSPLKGMIKLHSLELNNTAVIDLTPLHGMAGLKSLNLNQTEVSDLSPLRGLTGLEWLYLNKTKVTDLSPLQGLNSLRSLQCSYTSIDSLAPLRDLVDLQYLQLNKTAISDLTPLRGMTKLRSLSLSETSVSDIAALVGLTDLRTLLIPMTNVRDLRPMLHLPRLGSVAYSELSFYGTPAAYSEPKLRRIAGSGYHRKRTRETIAYLKTLPPWPEPLPWDIPDLAPTDPPQQPPDLDAVPHVEPSADGIDLVHSPIDAIDKADPIKRRIYGKLPEAVEVLYRFGNRYAEVRAPTDTLRNLVAVDFDDADLLDIHLQIAALTDARDLDAHKPELERFDADCLAALNSVLRLGPPVTLGHPDVDLLEQRSAEYARNRLPATVAEGERRMAKGIEASPRVAKERLRKVAGQVATASDTGRVAEYRRSLHRNTVLALAYVAGAMGEAATGFVAGEVTLAAAQFLLAHKDAIMATAPSWGETGYRWLEYIIIRAKQIVDEARNGKDD